MKTMVVCAALAGAVVMGGCHRPWAAGAAGVMRAQAAPPAPGTPVEVTAQSVDEAVRRGVELLLAMQEAEEKDGPRAQWPYEGVYRVGGEIPVGYRVGGTAIAVMALALAPGYDEDGPRREAVARATAFLCAARLREPMQVATYQAGYDVRAWGYIEAVQALALLEQKGRLPAGQEAACKEALLWYVVALQDVEMPRTGGWNYARPAGVEAVGAPSPFMTGPALQALFEAGALGYPVKKPVVARGLGVLEKARTASGAVLYSGEADAKSTGRLSNATPGSVGRMACTESVLLRAGRSTPERVRGALDAFIVHWGWLDQRRAQTGTHVAPYMVAPYYFMFAHGMAAECIEELPKSERDEYRRRVLGLMFSVRQEDGSWNDRVFKRSAAYGTAVAMMAMLEPGRTHAGWIEDPKP